MPQSRTVRVCGDSVLDNGAYVGLTGRALRSHLEGMLEDWALDFRALDGAVCADVAGRQLAGAGPCEAVVVSVGGNDALGHLHLLEAPEARPLIAFGLVLADIQDAFRADFARVLDAARGQAPDVLVMTIYRPRFHLDGMPMELQRAGSTLLSVFNDVIQEEALARGLAILDLRRVCDSDAHFANPIEPSDFGGREIAAAIRGWLDRRPA